MTERAVLGLVSSMSWIKTLKASKREINLLQIVGCCAFKIINDAFIGLSCAELNKTAKKTETVCLNCMNYMYMVIDYKLN